MMSCTQITLDPEIQRRVRQRGDRLKTPRKSNKIRAHNINIPALI